MPETLTYNLPLSMAQPLDLGRVVRELATIDEHLRQEAILNPEKQIAVKASHKLYDLITINNVDINNPEQRLSLASWLISLRKTAAVINVSFGTEASEDFIQKIAAWFRKEIDPECFIIVGLEPTIGVGSMVRTRNKVFDLSLKKRLETNNKLLFEQLQKVAAKAQP